MKQVSVWRNEPHLNLCRGQLIIAAQSKVLINLMRGWLHEDSDLGATICRCTLPGLRTVKKMGIFTLPQFILPLFCWFDPISHRKIIDLYQIRHLKISSLKGILSSIHICFPVPLPTSVNFLSGTDHTLTEQIQKGWQNLLPNFQ